MQAAFGLYTGTSCQTPPWALATVAAAIVRSMMVLVSMLGEVWVVVWLPAAQLDCRRLRVRCGVVHPRPGIGGLALSPDSGCKSEAGSGSRSKRGRSYGWRDNVMLGVHAKCEAKRARGVDGVGASGQGAHLEQLCEMNCGGGIAFPEDSIGISGNT